MTIFCILLTPLIIYIRIKAKSVIAASIIHGTTNRTAGLAIIIIKGGNDLTAGMFELSGIIVLAIANIVLFMYNHFWTKEPIKSY